MTAPRTEEGGKREAVQRPSLAETKLKPSRLRSCCCWREEESASNRALVSFLEGPAEDKGGVGAVRFVESATARGRVLRR